MASDPSVLPFRMGRRVLITLGGLCLFRLGCSLPLPGLDYGALGRLDGAAGSALARVSIFALGVTPIFSVMMIVEIAKLAFPALAWWEADRNNAARLRRGVQILALVMAAFQGLAIAHALEGVPGAVEAPDLAYYVEIAATYVGATAFLSWLGDRMTLLGLGVGFWLLLVAPDLARLAGAAFTAIELSRVGAIAASAIVVTIAYFIAAIALIVGLAKTRYAPFAFSADGETVRSRAGDAPVIDVWPPLLAQYAPTLVIAASSLFLRPSIGASFLVIGNPVRLLILAALIALFNVMRASSGGGYGAAPRPIWPTALAQVVVCCVGEALTRALDLPFALNGAWLIVVVATAMSVAQTGRLLDNRRISR